MRSILSTHRDLFADLDDFVKVDEANSGPKAGFASVRTVTVQGEIRSVDALEPEDDCLLVLAAGLDAPGCCGPSIFPRFFTRRESQIPN
jgi:hypothetical protein